MPFTTYALRMFQLMKITNTLPQQGGLEDQEPKMLEAFAVIADEIGKIEEKEMKQIEREAKKKNYRSK